MYLPIVISVLIGAALGSLLLLPLARERRPGQDVVQAPAEAPTEGVAPSPALRTRLAEDAVAAAEALLAAGRLREAQDAYLEALLLDPGSEEAWAGLILVRRRLARNDPVLLRRQAEALRRAIVGRTETEEHYAPPAMRLLAEASVRAAQQIEQTLHARQPSPQRPTPIVLAATPRARAAVTPASARPTPHAPRRAIRRPAPARPARGPTARPTARPTPRTQRTAPPVAVRAPLYLVQAGPLVSAAHAAEVWEALSRAGFLGRVVSSEGTEYYLLTLGPYRKALADAAVRFLTSRFPELTVAVARAE